MSAPTRPGAAPFPLALPVVLAVLVGCSGDAGPGGSITVRDSAGVTIVENAGPIWSAPPVWRLSAEPVLRIGALEGDDEYLFESIRGVVTLADGRIVVADGSTNTLRWFDPDGTFLFDFGGTGEGPGEFSRLGSLTRGAGDTLVAGDSSARRATVITPDGELVEIIRLEGVVGPPGAAYRLADGSLMAGVSGFSSMQLGDDDRQAGLRRFPAPIVRIGADPPRVDTVATFPGLELYFRMIGQGMAFGGHPFGRRLEYRVHDDLLYAAPAERFTVEVFEPNGSRVRSIRAPDADRPLAQAEIDEFRQAQLEAIEAAPDATAEQIQEARQDLMEMVFPEIRPPYEDLLMSRDGHIWLSEHAALDPEVRPWAVFDAEGRFVGTVTLPGSFRPDEVSTDRVIGRLTDELDVEYVVAYGLEAVAAP